MTKTDRGMFILKGKLGFGVWNWGEANSGKIPNGAGPFKKVLGPGAADGIQDNAYIGQSP